MFLHSIRWITQAWEQVHQDTIHKCFRKAGVLKDGEIVASALPDSADPFSDLDDDLELEDLISKVHGGTESCPVTEFFSSDDGLQICQEFGEDRDEILAASKRVNGGEEEELEEVEEPSAKEDESDHEELCANPFSA